MNDDYLHQLTLNCLINKSQLQKIHRKQHASEYKQQEFNKYKHRINALIQQLMANECPDDLLLDVKSTFQTFIEKSIYYFKTHDHNKAIELVRNSEPDIKEDYDYDKEERDMENGNYKEVDNRVASAHALEEEKDDDDDGCDCDCDCDYDC